MVNEMKIGSDVIPVHFECPACVSYHVQVFLNLFAPIVVVELCSEIREITFLLPDRKF